MMYFFAKQSSGYSLLFKVNKWGVRVRTIIPAYNNALSPSTELCPRGLMYAFLYLSIP